MKDYVVQTTCNYKRKNSGQVLLDLGLDFELLAQFFFFFTQFFFLVCFYTHETPTQRREQQPLRLRGKTHYNNCWVAAGQQAIEKLKA
jgi:hypothetical protein